MGEHIIVVDGNYKNFIIFINSDLNAYTVNYFTTILNSKLTCYFIVKYIKFLNNCTLTLNFYNIQLNLLKQNTFKINMYIYKNNYISTFFYNNFNFSI